jgi:hypothetical protein
MRYLLATALLFLMTACDALAQNYPPVTYAPVVPTGIKRQVGFFAALNPDCSSAGDSVARITKEPQNGSVEIENSGGYTNFPEKNQRYPCNLKLSQGLKINYTPKEGFVGKDNFEVEIFGPLGGTVVWKYVVTVK